MSSVPCVLQLKYCFCSASWKHNTDHVTRGNNTWPFLASRTLTVRILGTRWWTSAGYVNTAFVSLVMSEVFMEEAMFAAYGKQRQVHRQLLSNENNRNMSSLNTIQAESSSVSVWALTCRSTLLIKLCLFDVVRNKGSESQLCHSDRNECLD